MGDDPSEAGVVILGVPFEATVSYGRGTAQGPAAVLEASVQIDLFDLETGRPYEAGIAMLPLEPRIQAWNAAACERAAPVIEAEGAGSDPALQALAREVDGFSEQVAEWLYAETCRLLDAGRLVGVLGGDHSVPFGSIKAHAERFPGLGILHLDAHADLRVAYEGFTWSHASILHNVLERLPGVACAVGIGYRDFAESEWRRIEADPRLHALPDAHLRRALHEGRPFAALVRELIEPLPEQVYLSFDVDGLDPSLCPHTGTPVPGGLSFPEACTLLRVLAESGRRVVGFDLCEVAPDPEGRSEWDANVGARLLYKLIGFALRTRA